MLLAISKKKKRLHALGCVGFVQVPQVTEEIAMAVLDLYPTLLSLARAYSLLVSPNFLSVSKSID